MKFSSSGYNCVLLGLLFSDGSLVKGEYMGVTFVMEEGGEEGSIFTWKWIS